MQNTTIAAIATAPGAGGIAVVRLSGPESYAVAARVFHPANPNKNVEEAKGYTALFGSFVEGDDAFDEGVARFFREPHSYTGEDVVELSCHGGSAVARRLVEACLAAGAQPFPCVAVPCFSPHIPSCPVPAVPGWRAFSPAPQGAHGSTRRRREKYIRVP